MAPSKALEGGSERRGKVCCFVMHGSRSHVAEMMHDVFPPPLAAHGAGAEPACSMPTFPSPANIWKHLGRCSISVAAGDMWKVLEAPPPPQLEQSSPSPKHSRGRRTRGFSSVLGWGRRWCHWSPQHRDPSTRGGREAKGGGGLHPICADMLIPYTCPFFPGVAWPLHPPLSISHCLNQGAKPPRTRTQQHRWTERGPGWKEQAALAPK